MLSYHNDASLKSLVVQEMQKHQEQDQFIKRSYGREHNGKFKGCAVGCTIDSVNVLLEKTYNTSSHTVLEEALGVPVWLSRLQDSFFESLPVGENSQFAVDFLEAIPVGINLEPVKWKFCAFLMREGIERVLGLPHVSDALREQVVSAIRGVLALHEKAIETGEWDLEAAVSAWSAAESVESEARSVSASAVESASRAAAASAVASASRAAEAAVEAAVESAAWAARSEAAEAAEAAAYKRYAAELIRLLKEAV